MKWTRDAILFAVLFACILAQTALNVWQGSRLGLAHHQRDSLRVEVVRVAASLESERVLAREEHGRYRRVRLGLTRQRDSLRARTEELESGIRQYIMAAALLAQRNQVLEGQLSWCLNTPVANAP